MTTKFLLLAALVLLAASMRFIATAGKDTTWPWTRNRYDGRRYPLSWFMFRLSILLGGREVRLGNRTWQVTDEPHDTAAMREP